MMTATMERSSKISAQQVIQSGELRFYGAAATVDHRAASKARGLSPRLSDVRTTDGDAYSITVSRGMGTPPVRIPIKGARVVGARGSKTRSIERIHVREARRRPVRGYSRVGSCVRRSCHPTLVGSGLAALGMFAALMVLFGGAGTGADAAAASAASTPALTSIVTVRSGQNLAQVANEIAPDRPAAEVMGAVSEINGLIDGRVYAGQTLITPRY